MLVRETSMHAGNPSCCGRVRAYASKNARSHALKITDVHVHTISATGFKGDGSRRGVRSVDEKYV
jgi:hypothetical protein